MYRRASFVIFVGVFVALFSAGPALAQTAAPPSRFGILDNSFLVEEAFNQEAGVVQHIFTFVWSGRRQWDAAFTQEWPFKSERHQLSFTVPFSATSGSGAWGDVLLNYRLQVAAEDKGGAAVAPRLSLVLPTSAGARRLRRSGLGVQVNLPVSKQAGAVYLHGNAGATLRREQAAAPFLAGSAIVALTPMINLMVEGVALWEGDANQPRELAKTLSPGVRMGWNLRAGQLVLGAAVPITFANGRTVSALGYISFER